MYKAHPEFAWCKDRWKVHQLGIIEYLGWHCQPIHSSAIKKEIQPTNSVHESQKTIVAMTIKHTKKQSTHPSSKKIKTEHIIKSSMGQPPPIAMTSGSELAAPSNVPPCSSESVRPVCDAKNTPRDASAELQDHTNITLCTDLSLSPTPRPY
ncbi:hypothetical protein K439DRAFT_1621873 [Ramaria rubella]|nr:hypothetical protein K439DRAFT_1621873 [Ramaria rubella]